MDSVVLDQRALLKGYDGAEGLCTVELDMTCFTAWLSDTVFGACFCTGAKPASSICWLNKPMHIYAHLQMPNHM